MDTFSNDPQRNVAIFLNDFDQEFADGLEKLSKKLGRKLRGVILMDTEVKQAGRNTPDTNNVFEQIVCDFSDDADLHRTLKKLENNLLLITCSSERNQPYLQRVLPHVPYLPGPTETSLVWSTHKGKMREMLASYDPSLVPKVHVIHEYTEENIQEIVSKLQFPMIIKPTGLAVSILVSRVTSEAELHETLKSGFEDIHEIYERDRGRGAPAFIVEEFIEGDMYSIDVYVNGTGKVWPLPLLRSRTAYAMGREGFYMFQTDSYIELSDAEIKEGYAAAEKAVHALGLRASVAHIELFQTATGWKVIELGARAGGKRQDVYMAAYGIDHAYNELMLKCGLEPEMPGEPVAYCSTVNIYPDEEGVITAIEGYDEAMKNPSIYRFKQDAHPGDLALLSNRGGKFVADGLMCNKDREQLQKDVAFVRSTIKVKTKKQ
jgi:biotin carboxylase